LKLLVEKFFSSAPQSKKKRKRPKAKLNRERLS
jgi:hypothetical protein